MNWIGFYDKNFVLQPTTEENIFSVIAKDSMGEEVIGRYSAEPDELYFNRPVPIIEIQRIIESVRKSDDKK